MLSNPEEIADALAMPFDPSEVKSKPAVVTGNRALAMFYVDARVIQDRLDAALGVDGWQDDYECLACGSVVCRLRLRLGGEWVVKVDVGSQSEQPDDGDKMKAAFSDALKRAAVKFGVGRYLYRVPSQWCDYDPQKKRFVSPPQLPGFARPGAKPSPTKSAPAQPAPEQQPGCISRVQGAALADAMKRQGADPDMLFEEYAIHRLGEMPDNHFKDALARVNRGDFTPSVNAKPQPAEAF